MNEAADLEVLQTARRSSYGEQATLDGAPVRFHEVPGRGR